jgi:SAM-dependent methyltransferase
MNAVGGPSAPPPAGNNPWQLASAAALYDRVHTESADVALFLELARRAGGPILEVGCGTGRCLIPLIREGFDTVGIDSSDAMLAILRAKLCWEPEEVHHRATALFGDARTVAIPLRFGMAFLAANSFAHFLTKAEQEEFVGITFMHLRPGGTFVIDVFNPDYARLLALTSNHFECDGKSIVDEDLSVDRSSQTITVRTRIERAGAIEAQVDWTLRYTFRFELEHLLEKAGFEVAHVWGDYAKTAFSSSATRLVVVARKPFDADMAQLKLMRADVPQPA